ncbi:hypothetical protein [Nocardia sp. BMG111209]|uniref:hypothetical protein n=1 Tax=Nocardia sp. BMG111209 TaxID=1160137 RepID=UPI00036EFA69|nr:hypothetical protein [Nocardia sp. BMG111209]
MRKFAAYAALTVSAVGVAAAPAYADPAAAAPTTGVAIDQAGVIHVPASQTLEVNGVHYTVAQDGGSAVLTATDGSFKTVGSSLVVSNATGDAVDSIPLSYRKDATEFPIAAQISDNTVRLTPDTAPEAGKPVDHAITAEAIAAGQDVTKPQAKDVYESFSPRDLQELTAFSQRASISSTVGAITGAIIGGVGGCLIGAVVGSVSTAITTLLAGVLPGALVGCIAGAATVGAAGSLTGTIIATGPVLLWSAYQYFSTLSSPCVGPGTYCVDPNAPAPVPAK